MKKQFSTSWKASKQPRKQRKYLAKAPLHIKRKFLSANLSKELRKKYKIRSLPLRKEDQVKIMRGKFKKKEGKVVSVSIKTGRIIVEGIQVKKQDGSKANVPLRASKVQIITLNLDDKRRIKRFSKKSLTVKSEETNPNLTIKTMKGLKEEKKVKIVYSKEKIKENKNALEKTRSS